MPNRGIQRDESIEPAQWWRRRHGIDHREHVLEADVPTPCDGAPRMVEPERQPRIDVLRRAHALADGEHPLVHELADDPPEHEARRVPDPLGVEAERGKEPLGGIGRGVRGGGEAGELR